MASDSELCPEETSDNECKENYYPENFSAPPLASRRLDDKDFEHHDMTRSELGFIVSASNILGCVCEESGKRSFPNQFGDLFYDPLLLCRHDQHNKMQEFLCCCQDTAKWSVEVNVVAIIFAVRFSRNHAVTHGNWERVLLVALLLAQKMVDDRPLCNQDFPEAYHIWDAFDRNGGEAWQVRSPLELRKINQLELAFLQIVSCSSDVVLRDTESGLRVGARALWPNCPAPPTHTHTHARARARAHPTPPAAAAARARQH